MSALLTALLALGVGAPAWSALRGAAADRRWPPLGRFVPAQGGRAHVVERGAGPEVALIHGAASNARELLAALGDRLDGCRLIAPDRPGLGHSRRVAGAERLGVQAAFLADVLRATASGPVVAVGHSWGAAVSLRLALDHPDLVRALVLLAPASHPWPGGTGLANRLAATPVLGHALSWTLPALAGPFLMQAGIDKGFAPGPGVPGYGEIIGTPLLFRGATFRANAQDMARGSAELAAQAPRYADLRLPVAVVTGQGDRIVANALHAKGLMAALPHARSHKVPNAGHMPHWVEPERVADIILSFAQDGADRAIA